MTSPDGEVAVVARRVAFVIGSIRMGGAERSVVFVADALTEIGWEVTLYIASAPSESDIEVSPSVRVVRLPEIDPNRGSVRMLLALARRLRASIRNDHERVWVGFDRLSSIALRLAATGTGSAVVLAERTNPFAAATSLRVRLAVRLYYLGGPKVVVQTEGLRVRLARAYPGLGSVWVIPNVLDASRRDLLDRARLLTEERQPVLLFVGKLNENKGVLALLEAFRRSGIPSHGWRLKIVGSGPLEHDVSAAVQDAGLEDCVELCGLVPDPSTHFAEASILAVVSRYEGYPNVLIEGMFAGPAVVATNFEFGSELIDDDVNGLKVSVGDVDALSAGLSRLARDASLRDRLSRNALNTVNTTVPSAVASSWHEALQSALTSGTT